MRHSGISAAGLGGVLTLAAAIFPAAADGMRLAATMVTAHDAAALVEVEQGQAWVRAGDRVGECRALAIERQALWLACHDGNSTLVLEHGTAGVVDTRPAATLHSTELPAGLLQSLVARPQALALAADFVPAVRDGTLVGWRVARIDPRGPLADLGLHEADLVLALDGAPAAEPGAFAAALRTLAAAETFSIDLLRGRQALTLLISAPVMARP